MALRLQAKPAFETWSVEDVCDWLDILGLGKYRQKFNDEAISGQVLLEMEEKDMREHFGLPWGDASLLKKEVHAQKAVSIQKKKPRTPVVLRKGELGQGEPLSETQRNRIRHYSGDGVRRANPLTDEELECWDYQASWLCCAVTGKPWTDSGSIIGMALYHQPRFCTEAELNRRKLEDEQAARKKHADGATQNCQATEKPEEKVGEAEDDESTAESEEESASVWEVVGSKGSQPAGKEEYAPAEETAPKTRNSGIGMGEDYDREFDVYPDVEPPACMHMQPMPTGSQCRRLGCIEVMVGPVFDIKAFNNGASGSSEAGTLGLADRGVTCLDRQYNAVNFQFFVQRHPNSYARRLCTSRLSFYIEEGHGARVFPGNILSQLSLLFYRNNHTCNRHGRTDETETAECIMRAIPKILLQTVMEIVTGVGFEQYTEHAVRLYLLVHHTAIKLLSYFPKAHQRVYDKVKEWIQNPFMEDAIWGPEEAMLAASLVSVPFGILRDVVVRRVLLDMSGAADASCAKLLKQNQEMLSRIAFVHSFFEAGPGRLKVKDLEVKYTRCAGTLPKAEREQLLATVKHTAVESCEDWWRTMGMNNIFSEDETCARNLIVLREHVLKSEAKWKLAPRPLPTKAATHRAGLGAEELGVCNVPQPPAHHGRYLTKAQRLQRQAEELAEARKQHEGYPTLADGKLSDSTCLYCGKCFGTREKLFQHLKKMIPKERMIRGWHQLHFAAGPVTQGALTTQQPLRCPAVCCAAKTFDTAEDLLEHMKLMGVRGADSLTLPGAPVTEEMDNAEEHEQEHDKETEQDELAEEATAEDVTEQAPVDPFADVGKCYKCSKQRSMLFAHCGHCVACTECSQALTSCPVCSEEISQKIQVCWS